MNLIEAEVSGSTGALRRSRGTVGRRLQDASGPRADRHPPRVRDADRGRRPACRYDPPDRGQFGGHQILPGRIRRRAESSSCPRSMPVPAGADRLKIRTGRGQCLCRRLARGAASFGRRPSEKAVLMDKVQKNRGWFPQVLPVLVLVAFSCGDPAMTVVNYSLQTLFREPRLSFWEGSAGFEVCCSPPRVSMGPSDGNSLSRRFILAIQIPLGIAIAALHAQARGVWASVLPVPHWRGRC